MKSVPSASKRLDSTRIFVLKYSFSSAKGYRGCIQRAPKSNMWASLPLIQDTKLSVYLLVGWLHVDVVSTHAPIFIFPSIPINVLTHSTEFASIFTSVKSIIYSLYLCELFIGVLLSPQMGTSEAQLMPAACHRKPDVNPSTRVSLCDLCDCTLCLSNPVLLRSSGSLVLPKPCPLSHLFPFYFITQLIEMPEERTPRCVIIIHFQLA